MARVLVVFDAMRHGDKDGDKLTLKGREQVAASAKKNLISRRASYWNLFYSGAQRAKETAQIVAEVVNGTIDPVYPILEPGFGFQWSDDQQNPKYPIAEAQARVKSRIDSGETETVEVWLEEWVPTHAIRGRFMATLEKWALWLVNTPHAKEVIERGKLGEVLTFNCFIASHSPTCELACLDPANTPRLREADGVTYQMEVDIEL